jgi:hypothetical protein
VSVTARAIAAAVAAGCAAAAGAGCGTPSPDLFVKHRDGTVPGAKLEMLVSDTTARCNGGPVHPLTSAQTLQARDLLRDLLAIQNGEVKVPRAPAAQIFRYAVETEKGTLRYPDTAQKPPVLPRLTLFVRRVAIDTCGLAR